MAEERFVTLPNVIAFSRILAVVPLFFLLAYPTYYTILGFICSSYTLAFVVVCYAGASDWLDGYMARRGNYPQKIGALLDPVADKIFIMWAMYALGLPVWLILLVATRDYFVSMIRSISASLGLPFKTSISAKGKTMILFACVGLEILGRAINPGLHLWDELFATWIIVWLTVWTLGDYTFSCLFQLAASRRPSSSKSP